MTANISTSLQRKSVFPPLLGSVRETSISDQNTEGRLQPVGSTKQPLATVPERKRQKSLVSKPATKTVDNERDVELRQRQHMKAEALVRKWDSLLVREREDRHTQLLQRLDLQRSLIAKNELAFRQSLNDAKEKRLQEVQARRDHQKKMIQDLRAHAKRIDEHKKMVAVKVRERGLSVAQSERDEVSPELRHLQFEENKETDDERAEEVRSDGFPADFGHTSRLQQLLEFDPVREATPTISSAWVMLKRDHSRKLEPILEYSLHTRELANPTSKVFLKYYDEPIRLSNSGEKVPLSEVVEMEAQKRDVDLGRDSMLMHAVEQRTRGNQARAEALLHRKQTQVEVPIQEPTMYLPREEYDRYLHEPLQHLPPTRALDQELMRLSPAQNIAPKIKKRQHKYLTEKGCVTTQEAARSTFLTDGEQECERGSAAKPRSRWQPLSCSAAQEYQGTHVVPLKVFSSQGHGRYSLWKPLSSYYA